ncbi:hypothetical protein A9Q96_01000 [Rhodobacterales bacterium 52_120_T64]|nr:hypothetical protein A9Q96_01000 [Rhodobacterales bacterium 52_120_T64]
MRDNKYMLHRTIPRYRHLVFSAILLLSTAACGGLVTLGNPDISPSDYAIQHGYPDLLPASAFRIADYTVPDPSNLLARFAMLKRKIIALRGPVLSSSDRTRLETALKRTASTQG